MFGSINHPAGMRVPSPSFSVDTPSFEPYKVSWSNAFDCYTYLDKKYLIHLVTPVQRYDHHNGHYFTVLDEVLANSGYRIMPRTYGRYKSYDACLQAIKRMY